MIHKKFLSIVVLVFFCPVLHAVEIVRFDFQANNVSYTLDLELFDDITPITVANFLKYTEEITGIDGGRYDNSFIHRGLDAFVIQGGGYTYDPFLGGFLYDSTTNTYPEGLQEIEAFEPIVNEFPGSNLSNLRGTIAMAKLSSGPDTATSQWFFNLSDNSQSLDQQNGGFTVFGQVLDDGLITLDSLSAIPTFNLSTTHFAFSDIPLSSYVVDDLVLQENLMQIITVRKIQRPILVVTPDMVDLGLVLIGQSSTTIVSLKNRGNVDLVIDTVNVIELGSSFTILSENCSTQTLRPVGLTAIDDTCSVTIQFSPSTTGDLSAQLEIVPIDNPNNVDFTIDIIGEGIPITPALAEQDKVILVDFLAIFTNEQTTKSVVLQNRGGGSLAITSLTISGADSLSFSLDNGCTNSTVLLSLETCTLVITANPDTAGIKTANLRVESDGGILDIALAATAEGPTISIDPFLLVDGNFVLDVGDTFIGNTALSGIIIENKGRANLIISDAILIEGDINDYTIDTTRCEPVLAPRDLCAIVLTIASTTNGAKAATLEISSNDVENSTVLVSIIANVGPPDIDAPNELFVGTGEVDGAAIFKQLTVINGGIGGLQFNAFSLTGVDADDFLIGSSCPGLVTPSTVLLKSGESCGVAIQFIADSRGLKMATLELLSNDPDESTFAIALTAFGDLDSDGVSSEIEQSAPNSGDGNNDLLQDSVQNNVVSFLTTAGKYVTLASPTGTLITDFEVVLNPEVDLPSSNTRFDHGSFTFNILAASAVPGAVVQLGVFLPSGDESDQFYKFGPTPDNVEPHWYNFEYDGRTGTQYFGDIEVSPEGGGAAVKRSFFLLSFIDGERGDDDLTVDGRISSLGALGAPVNDSSNGSSGAVSWLLLTVISLFYRFYNYRRIYLKSN